MEIPPPGWGAVEILLWDYYQELTKQGETVEIINLMRKTDAEQKDPNTPYCRRLIDTINQGQYDFVHLHYDCLYHILPFLTCPNLAITSHYPYIDQIDKHAGDGFDKVFSAMCKNQGFRIFALSQKDYDAFARHCDRPGNLVLMRNGASEEIGMVAEGKHKDRSIYIGKVEPRKNQWKYSSLPLDFYGRCEDPAFRKLEAYKGELPHSEMMKVMAEYGNVVLLSSGENGTPLVIKEALMAGLPVVINRHSANDLEPAPFIAVIPEDREEDLEYIAKVIEENRRVGNREEIREYALKFSWARLVEEYRKNLAPLASLPPAPLAPLRIAIIGPNSPIPPTGWGAVESLIWDYRCKLEELGHSVLVIHQADDGTIQEKVNAFRPDVIHIQYDDFWYLWDTFDCKKVLITNHFAYLEHPQLRKLDHMYGISSSKAVVHCLSPGIARVYRDDFGVGEERLFVLPNGASEDAFRFLETPEYPDRSVYLAKIDYRKRQYQYQNLPGIDFVGNLADPRFKALGNGNYKGEWKKAELYENLTKYANLVLLSDGEAHPLVCCEALVAGLGLVVSEVAAANLDRSLPWIDVIPKEKMDDLGYIQEVLIKNREVAVRHRKEIREYGLMVFSWTVIVEKYVGFLRNYVALG